jgi:hypothetical protein
MPKVGNAAAANVNLTKFRAIKQIAVLWPIQSFNPALSFLDGSNKRRSSMHAPIQITFEGVPRSDAIEGRIRQEWENLNDIGAPITSSRVVVTKPRAKHFSGHPCRLRVHLTIESGSDINVNHDPGAGRRHDAMQLAVRDAFRIVRRRLEDSMRRRNSDL